MRKSYYYLILILVMGFASCNDNDEQKEILNNRYMKGNHFIDDIPVWENAYFAESEDMFLVEIYKPVDNLKSVSDSVNVEYRAYSSEQKYVEFGQELGYDFEKELEFQRIMTEFAEESGALKEYEEKGSTPSWYKDKERIVYDSIFNNSSLEKSVSSMLITLYDKPYVPGEEVGSKVIMTAVLPAMYPGWNNRVSCVEFIGIGGVLVVFDKTFYRKRVATVVNFGLTRINLKGGADNKMSSGLSMY